MPTFSVAPEPPPGTGSLIGRGARFVIKFTLYSGNPFVDAAGWLFFVPPVTAGGGEENRIAAMFEQWEAERAAGLTLQQALRQNMAASDP